MTNTILSASLCARPKLISSKRIATALAVKLHMVVKEKEKKNEKMQTFQYAITTLSLQQLPVQKYNLRRRKKFIVLMCFLLSCPKTKEQEQKTTHFRRVIFCQLFFLAQMLKKVNGKNTFQIIFYYKMQDVVLGDNVHSCPLNKKKTFSLFLLSELSGKIAGHKIFDMPGKI